MGDDFGRIYDGAVLERTFDHLHARLAWLFTIVGVNDVVTQKVLILALAVMVLWLVARRVSTVGYRVSVPVGVTVQAFTLGPVLTLLLVVIPAWVTFRHEAIAKTLLSLFR